MKEKIDRDTVYQEVLEGLEEALAWVRGEKELRVTRIEVPDRPVSKRRAKTPVANPRSPDTD